MVPPVTINTTAIAARSGCSAVHQSFISTQFANIVAVGGVCVFFILDMLHDLIARTFGAGDSNPLITVTTGVAFLTTAVAINLFLGETCRDSLIVSLLIIAVAARIITVVLLVIIVSWINFVVGKCISSCRNRNGILVVA